MEAGHEIRYNECKRCNEQKYNYVEKDNTIRLAITKMVHGEFGAVVVTENGKPIGILTERDILKSILMK